MAARHRTPCRPPIAGRDPVSWQKNTDSVKFSGLPPAPPVTVRVACRPAKLPRPLISSWALMVPSGAMATAKSGICQVAWMSCYCPGARLCSYQVRAAVRMAYSREGPGTCAGLYRAGGNLEQRVAAHLRDDGVGFDG